MIRNNNGQSVDIGQRLNDIGGIQHALRRAARKAVEEHAKSGRKIVVWRQDQMVWEVPTIVSENVQSAGRELIELLAAVQAGLDNATNDAVDAIIEIQSTPIPADKLSGAIDLLVEFIKKHRGTNSQNVVVAVGAAIRKVLLNVSDEQLGLGAELMKSAGNLEVPIEVELEVAKMVVHRFRYAPNTSTAGLTELADLLLENAKVYSKANLVNRDFYGATALNSVLSVVLMRHEDASVLIAHVEEVSPKWFVDLVKSRLRRMSKEIDNEELEDSRELTDFMKKLGAKSGDSTSTQAEG